MYSREEMLLEIYAMPIPHKSLLSPSLLLINFFQTTARIDRLAFKTVDSKA